MSSSCRTLSVAELKAHAEYPHIFWKLKPTQSGLTPVASDRGGPLDIAWEIHGHGPNRIVWIMGLGGYKEAWQRQTRDFSHAHPETYSSLILDNRGIGDSGKPLMRYSTSEMARDVLEILAHVGWLAASSSSSSSSSTSPTSSSTTSDDAATSSSKTSGIHVVGISMGGMIAQELALLAPKGALASLTLVSTAPRIVNTVGWLENLRNRINLFIPKSIEEQIQITERNLFREAWLRLPDETEAEVQKFPTNGDRFAAGEVAKRTENDGKFSRVGFVCQALAAGWHHKTAEQLKELADRVGRDRIAVVHGTGDRMLVFKHGEMLMEELGGEASGVSEFFFEGIGHVVPVERREDFYKIVEGMVRKGRELDETSGRRT